MLQDRIAINFARSLRISVHMGPMYEITAGGCWCVLIDSFQTFMCSLLDPILLNLSCKHHLLILNVMQLIPAIRHYYPSFIMHERWKKTIRWDRRNKRSPYPRQPSSDAYSSWRTWQTEGLYITTPGPHRNPQQSRWCFRSCVILKVAVNHSEGAETEAGRLVLPLLNEHPYSEL